MKSRAGSLVLLVVLVGTRLSEAQPKQPGAPAAPRTSSAPATACLIVNGPSGNNVAFELSTEFAKPDTEKDREYAIAERASYQGVTFYLRHGHGVVRLEAWIQGKRVASTFF